MWRLGVWSCLVLLGASACASARNAEPAPAARRTDLSAAEHAALASAGVDPSAIRCNSDATWSTTLRADAKAAAAEILGALTSAGVVFDAAQAEAARKAATDIVFWRLVLAGLIDANHNNLGVVALRGLQTADGRPLVLFRTAFTPDPDAPNSCAQSLVHAGGVRHAVNLYAGPMPTLALEAAERRALQAVQGSYRSARDADAQMQWREDLRASETPETQRKAMLAVAQTLRELLYPLGGLPKGHLWVHCGGGMHRTGMVVGILERCVNGASMDEVAQSFQRHVAWHSPQDPGGFERANLDFIAAFDCSLLRER